MGDGARSGGFKAPDTGLTMPIATSYVGHSLRSDDACSFVSITFDVQVSAP